MRLIVALACIIFGVCLVPSARADAAMPQRDPQDPHRFLMNGQPWHAAGYYPGLGDALMVRPDAISLHDYATELLDKLAANRLNYCRLLLGFNQSGGGIYTQESLPYVKVGTVTSGQYTYATVDLDQFNQAHFDHVRNVIDHARSKNIVIQLCIHDSWHINNVSGPWRREFDFFSPGMNVNGVAVSTGEAWHSTDTQSIAWLRHTALTRKVIDSVGDLPNIVWEVSNEPNRYYDGQSYPGRPPPFNDWTFQIGNYIKSYELISRGYNHLCMPVDLPDHQHTAGQRPDFFATSQVESDGHTPAGTHRDLLFQIANNIPAVLPQPLMVDNDAGGSALSPDEARQKAWACLTATAHIDYFQDELGDINVLRSQEVADRMRYIGCLNKFVADLSVTLRGMTASDHLVTSGWCSARSGNEYVVYLTAGGSTIVTGLPSPFAAKWFNPRNGMNQAAAGGPTFTAPDSNDWVLHVVAASPRPYLGTPAPIPGLIQAEDYDLGGEGVAYHDTTPGNSGAAYRSEDVDIQATTDTGADFNVTSTAASEWLEYTVEVFPTALYALALRIAAPAAGGQVSVKLDGTSLIGPINVPATGDGQTWATLSFPDVEIAAGGHILRVAIDSGGFNLNWIDAVLVKRLVPADFDRDGDADQADFGMLQKCFSGLADYAPGCGPTDLNDDGKVNASDLNAFLDCMAGSGQGPSC